MANLTRFDPFHEMISLRQAIDSLFGEKANATFDNGVLTLRVPKAEDLKPKQIQIKAGASQSMTVTPTPGNGSESN